MLSWIWTSIFVKVMKVRHCGVTGLLVFQNVCVKTQHPVIPSQLPAADLLTVTNTYIPTWMTPIRDWQKSATHFLSPELPCPPPPPPALPSLMAEVTWSGCRNGRNLLFEISSREVVYCSSRSHDKMGHVLEGHSFEFLWVCVRGPAMVVVSARWTGLK